MALYLAGDIGGTKTVLALYALKNNKLLQLEKEYYESARFKSFESILKNFMQITDIHKVTAACFGVAGPVVEGVVKTTNLPWTINAAALAKTTGIRDIALLNDFEAIGYGIPVLEQKDLVRLSTAKVVSQTAKAVIGAGTGLGEGILAWHGSHYVAIASEGGHSSFAAKTKIDWMLVQHLQKKLKRDVEWEDVLSGRGLINLYEFLRANNYARESKQVRKLLAHIGAAAITENTSKDTLCKKAVELFVRYYGREASNLGLKAKATGGVYLAGGIAPKIIPFLKKQYFMQEFLGKSRMQHLLQRIPVFVVTNQEVGLLGAANFAMHLLETE